MMPNKTPKNNAVLFECECGNSHYVELWYEEFNDKILFGSGLWLNFRDHGASLWRVLKQWWNGRIYWHSEILLTPDDIKAMHEKLGQYLKEYEEYKLKENVK